MSGTGETDSQCRDIQVNMTIMEEFFLFVFGSVVTTYGSDKILPPKFRQDYKNPTYTEFKGASSPSTFPSFFTRLSSHIWHQLLRTNTWAWYLAFQMFGATLITFSANLEVASLPGMFKRINKRHAVLFYNE
jgi:hypothetical protein